MHLKLESSFESVIFCSNTFPSILLENGEYLEQDTRQENGLDILKWSLKVRISLRLMYGEGPIFIRLLGGK